MTIDPRFLSIERWSAMTSQLIAPLGFTAHQVNEDGWKTWGQAIKQVPRLAGLNIPDPRLYADDAWREWGFRLNEVLINLGL